MKANVGCVDRLGRVLTLADVEVRLHHRLS